MRLVLVVLHQLLLLIWSASGHCWQQLWIRVLEPATGSPANMACWWHMEGSSEAVHRWRQV